MRSLRFRLFALWIMLVASGTATAYLLFESFQQGSNARLLRSEELAARACRDIADRYQFFVTGWSGRPVASPPCARLPVARSARRRHRLDHDARLRRRRPGL